MAIRGENRQQPAYTDLRRIPGGAAGIVHLGRHVGYNEECVQKTYPTHGRVDALAYTEPRLLRELRHDHIVEILDCQPDGELRDHATMVMPYYPAGDLRALIERGQRLSVGQVIEWTRQISSALDYLHTEKRYLHRDVKPGNILIGRVGQTLLCDFGTAAAMSVSGHTGPVRATAPYQPPEVFRNGWMCGKSDVYSLGLTAIELLDGAFLYEGVDIADLQQRVDTGRRAYSDSKLASGRRAPHVPAALRTLLSRCVDVDPDRRPSASQLEHDLHHLRYVDWRHSIGAGLDGEWHGTWPPRSRLDKTIELRVTSNIAVRGKHTGKRVLTADYRKTATSGWRTIGSTASPRVLDEPHDATAVSAFFKTVADIAARRFPA